jgi:hypothetical protein
MDTGLKIKKVGKKHQCHFEYNFEENSIMFRRRWKQCTNRNKSNSILIYQNMYSRILRDYYKRSEADSIQGYQPYGGQRLAYFSPDEMQSQAMTRGYANAGTPQAYTDAQTRFGAQTPYNSGYTAGAAPQGYQAGTVGPTYQAGAYNQGYQAGPFDAGYSAGNRQTGYDPTIRQSGYSAGQTAQTYNPLGYEQNISRFMSPYQQNVTDIEKREAARQSEIMGKGIGDQATAQGGLGGYREAIQQSERERNLSQQMGDIQTRGSQAAYQNAQAQLERERAGGMGAAISNATICTATARCSTVTSISSTTTSISTTGCSRIRFISSSRSCSSSTRKDLDKVHTICLIAITWLLLKVYKALVVLNKQMCFLEYKLYKALVHKTEPYDKQVWTWDTMIFKDKETFLNNSLVTLVVC